MVDGHMGKRKGPQKGPHRRDCRALSLALAADPCPRDSVALTRSPASPGHGPPCATGPTRSGPSGHRTPSSRAPPSQALPLQERPSQERPSQEPSSQELRARARPCRVPARNGPAGREPARDCRADSSPTNTSRAKLSLAGTSRFPLLLPASIALALKTLAAPALATPAAAETVLERVLARLGDARPVTGFFVNNAENSGAGGSTPRIDGSILLRVSNRINAVDAAAPAITAATLPQIATGNLSTTAIGATNSGDLFTQFRLQAGFDPAPADPGIDPDPAPRMAPDANGFSDLGSGAVMTGLNAALDHAATASARATRMRSGPMGVDPQAVMLLANAAANTGDIAGSITIVLGGVDGRIAASDTDLAIGSEHGALPDGIAALLGRLDTTALGSVNTGLIVSGVSGQVGAVINGITGSR